MSIISRTPFNFKLGWGDTHSKPEVTLNVSDPNEGFTKLIAGLGNVGQEYEGTRHNIGFDIIDAYAKGNSFPGFKQSKKFFGLTSEKFIEGKKIILLKPTTLMNLSGKSVNAVQKFYNIPPTDITVIHDELDLDFGDIRIKQGGNSKTTHNGLKDTSNRIGSTNYRRIRFGINNRPVEKMVGKNFVLGKFNKEEQSKLKSLIKEAVGLI